MSGAPRDGEENIPNEGEGVSRFSCVLLRALKESAPESFIQHRRSTGLTIIDGRFDLKDIARRILESW